MKLIAYSMPHFAARCKITWERIKYLMTKAGRFLLALKSEKGKGVTTTSPFTNLPMPNPLLDDSNRAREQLPRQPSSGRLRKLGQTRFVRWRVRLNKK